MSNEAFMESAERLRTMRYKTWTQWRSKEGNVMTLGHGELMDLEVIKDHFIRKDDSEQWHPTWIESEFPGVRVGHRGSKFWCCTLPECSDVIQSNVFYLRDDHTRGEVRRLLSALGAK